MSDSATIAVHSFKIDELRVELRSHKEDYKQLVKRVKVLEGQLAKVQSSSDDLADHILAFEMASNVSAPSLDVGSLLALIRTEVRREVHGQKDFQIVKDEINILKAQVANLKAERGDTGKGKVESNDQRTIVQFDADQSKVERGRQWTDDYSPLPTFVADEGMSSDGRQAASSIYSYCVYRLSESQSPLREQALWLLLFLCLTQFFLLYESFTYLQLIQLPKHLRDDQHLLGDPFSVAEVCISGYSQLGSKPLSYYLVLGLCVVILGVSSTPHQCELLITVHPKLRSDSNVARLVLNYGWFVQHAVVPVAFLVNAAMLLVLATNVQDLILNVLQIAFILDIDDILYEGLLGEREKAEYVNAVAALQQRRSPHKMPSVKQVERSLSMQNVLFLTIYLAYRMVIDKWHWPSIGEFVWVQNWPSVPCFVIYFAVKSKTLLDYNNLLTGAQNYSAPMPWCRAFMIGIAALMHFWCYVLAFRPKFFSPPSMVPCLENV